MQSKLLKVLDHGELRRVGGVRTITVDVRVIVATNRDVDELVRAGRLREDLLHRVDVIRITMPPLRDRPEDIPRFVTHVLTMQQRRGLGEKKVTPQAMRVLQSYAWPGNVRELANIMERLAILVAGDAVTADDVARVVPQDGTGDVTRSRAAAPSDDWTDIALTEALDGFERTLIARALSAARGNVADAARKLATDRANLYRRMRRLGLEPPRNVAG